MENVRKHRDIKWVTEDKRRNQLVLEPNYWMIKGFSENLVGIELKNLLRIFSIRFKQNCNV